ncbi:restriction endonuclease subunit S [Metapseudomonas otitidis]|uniref:restriction endonuclease subunit S n=1 Tax=Metapseudomonas otitidis TaxID=319939 RepID=UPI0008F0F48F|nr:restriction endonuclease subunit S [Pseudomonas otitidis]MDH1107144.1 restriction endonuclease subunit S [Pseudomonas otitidis]MDH1157299.1 restriction endonuclease subunit S [Pseudomonas otitidis]MDH1165286.1 restriction endonuclease subunit S [Pseudomonas otitidis]SFA65503.1 Restriction endonuclease S subunit [Pseudomonas otitidis]
MSQVFPAHWDVLPFSLAVKDATSEYSKLQKSEYLEQGRFPIVDQGQQKFGGYTDDESVVSLGGCPAVIFGDHTRIFKFIDEPFCLGADGAKVLEPKVELDKKFLFYYLSSLNIESAGYSRHFKFLKENVVPVPPLPEQKRIATILDKADAIRRKRQQTIQLADDFLRAVFLDMFGDPVTNPKGWEVKLLKDLSLKIHSGNTPKGGKENYVESGVVFLRSQNVWKRKIILDDVAYIDAATHRKMAGSSLKHQDILMTKTGRFNTENSSLGRAAMFFGEDNSANVNGHVYLIRLGGKVDKKFVLFILTMPEYYEYIRSVCVGGIDKRQLNKEHLENFPIIFPSADMQRRFSEILDVVDSAKVQAANALLSAEMMFDALSQKAFSGQL